MAAKQTGNAVLVFENTEFDIVDIHNVPWLRLPQIGVALDYANPYKVQQLYERNADEFTDEMTQVVELKTAGGLQPVRIFSPRGCYLLGMLARTPKAKAFRSWVLDVLEGKVSPIEHKPFAGAQIISAHRHVTALLKELKRETVPAVRRVLHAQLTQACRMSSLPCPALEEIGRDEMPEEVPAVVEAFWEIVELIGLENLNHSRSTDTIAINLIHFQRLASEARIKSPPLIEIKRVLRLSTSPRFIAIKAVNSLLLNRSVKCWVFAPE